ncbi:MAG: hypothetical protein ACHQM6_03300 [Candidatus Kapaibacterium sp.]
MKNRQFITDAFGWGFILWLIGYVLGIILFMIIPASILGWVIMPIGIIITLWVLLKKVKGDTFRYYVFLAIIWTLIAVIFDYLLIVKIFSPTEGYYKLDVYLYYIVTFVLPIGVGWSKTKNRRIAK